MLVVLARRYGLIDTLLVGVGLAVQVATISGLARTFDPLQVLKNYRRVMRINCASATALGGYVLVRLALDGR
jgi:hypothetical protein